MKVILERDMITASLNLKLEKLAALPENSLEKYKELTPKRTGNARSKTTLNKQTIIAGYPYAEPLDKGASKQAPKGMTLPFSLWLRRQADLIIKRK